MRRRCLSSTDLYYPSYGGRGITIDREWATFPAFYEWAIANGYRRGLHLDRIDNDAGYAPGNCRFTTPRVNARNRRDTVWLTAFGETRRLVEWLDDPRCAVCDMTLRHRLRRFWQPERALTTPPTRTSSHAS